MKWDDKHGKAKEIIGAALGEAQLWFNNKEKTKGLTEEEVGEVNKELTLMLESISKRYKIEVNSGVEIPLEPLAEVKTDEAEDEPQKEEKPKRGRKKASEDDGKKTRRSRTKKSDD